MKIVHLLLVTLLTIFLTACGSDNSESVSADSTNPTNQTDTTETDNTIDGSSTVNVVIVGGDSKTLTTNNQQVAITVRVLNTDNSPYSEGTVKVAYPDKVQLGTDVGSFASSSVTIDENGNAVFNYTAPDDLEERVNAGDTTTVFGFYHESSMESIKYYTLTYSPLPNQIVLTDYYLKESASSESFTMGLESTRQAAFYVENSNHDKLLDSAITSMVVTLKNPELAELRDTTGNVGDQLSFTTNNVSVNITSNTRAGIVPIEVNATFVDANKATKNIVEVFNLTIFSGPPTAMSISYQGTAHDETNAKFQEHMVITVTDKYSNPVNTQPAVASYLIAGYALENTVDPASRIIFATNDAKAATMNPTDNTLTSSANFANVDLANDILMTYANGYTYNISGKWDIGSISGGTLTLTDTMEATANVSNVGFAIGNNYRQDVCRDAREWLGFVTLSSDRLDVNGMAHATINYDYYLTGKKVILGVDIIGYTANGEITSKFGEAVSHTLLSTGLESPKCEVAPNASVICDIRIQIAGTGEYYSNANIKNDYAVKVSDNLVVNSISDSNNNIFDCTASGGQAFVRVNITETQNRAGTVSLENLNVASEF